MSSVPESTPLTLGRAALLRSARLLALLRSGLMLLWGSYLLSCSLFFLLAFQPYTYHAVIRALPFDWMPWFLRNSAVLYWIAALGGTLAFWSSSRRRNVFVVVAHLLFGIAFTAAGALSNLKDGWGSLYWGIALATFMLSMLAMQIVQAILASSDRDSNAAPLGYANIIVAGLVLCSLSAIGANIQFFSRFREIGFSGVAVAALTAAAHLTVAVVFVCLVNILTILAARIRRPLLAKVGAIALLLFLPIFIALLRCAAEALTFQGWPAMFYCSALSGALACWGVSLVLQFSVGTRGQTQPRTHWGLIAIALLLGSLTVCLPFLLGSRDWNSIFQRLVTVFIWVLVGFLAYRIFPNRKSRTLRATAAILLFVIAGFQLGRASLLRLFSQSNTTDPVVNLGIETYAMRDVSFDLSYHLLTPKPASACDGDCQLMTHLTNMHEGVITRDLKLVENLQPSAEKLPNVFILVIDSLRPDFIGAYNPRADFTPNLDAFARESFAYRNAFTDYAGTTLSEPAIWAGALLPHAHPPQPYERWNSTYRLAKTDNYQLIVSYDSVVRSFVPDSPDIVKFDSGPAWTRVDLCTNARDLDGVLAGRGDPRPILFFSQPMNVHQLSRMPIRTSESNGWHPREGFDDRAARAVHDIDGCFADFVSVLKKRGVYDNSIIVLTADHGDALGDFGRHSHSSLLFPEVMRVPLIIHVPERYSKTMVTDTDRVATLLDIAPTIFYLSGHRPILQSPILGKPLLAQSRQELESYPVHDIFLASDSSPFYGVLSPDMKSLYMNYASRPQSFLFDLATDPNALHDQLTPAKKTEYDARIVEYLKMINEYYGYKQKELFYGRQ